ncbi:MAG: hypothetical protein JWR18_2266 [Segetibacter sp.]|jgi:hypothetical protein|nr:hypothetical protein [Segetibacter sp.]
MIRVTLPVSRLIRLVFITFAVLFIHPSAHSKPFTESPKAQLVTKLPFMLTSRGIIILQGHFGAFPDTLNFILDTGSGGISLDSATAKHFHLTPSMTDETIRGLAQRKAGEFLFDQQLRLRTLKVDHLNFHINDYSFLSDAYNVKIDGVIGYSFLKSYIVKVNYEKLIIEIWSPGNIDYPKAGHVIKTTVTKLAAIGATVNDNRKIEGNFYFDTGADMCFLLPDKFIKDSSVLRSNKKILPSGAQGLGGRKEMMLTTVDEVNIGPYTLKKVPAFIFDDSYNVSNYPATGGIIGNELMERFNLVINYPANEIHIVPNAMFNTPFDYSYVGCNLILENGKAIIKDIIKDSPAHLAGLKNNDVIFGIDNNFTNDVEEYRNLLSKPGAKLKVFLLRGNVVESALVEVKSIL